MAAMICHVMCAACRAAAGVQCGDVQLAAGTALATTIPSAARSRHN
jgi:tetrahydromethanopterin S-methyltransferase subunit D